MLNFKGEVYGFMELISIIMPIYNSSETLTKAIDSCLHQKYPDTEIILVNDGSDVETTKIIKDYEERYSSIIKVVNQHHQGILQARLNGLKHASGTYVTFVDSDDYINRVYLYELMYAKRYSDADIVLGKMNYVKNALITDASKVYPNEFKISDDPKFLLTIDSCLNGKLFKRKKLVLPNYKLSVNETLPSLYYYLCQEDKICFSNFSKYYVTSHKNSTDSIFNSNLSSIEGIIRPLDIMYDLFKSGKLLNKYFNEVEAIFIRNIFLEIDNLQKKFKDKELTEKITIILIKYLNYHFPSWRQNKYLKRHFIDFKSDIFLKLNLISLNALSYKTTTALDSSETIRGFKKIIKS